MYITDGLVSEIKIGNTLLSSGSSKGGSFIRTLCVMIWPWLAILLFQMLSSIYGGIFGQRL